MRNSHTNLRPIGPFLLSFVVGCNFSQHDDATFTQESIEMSAAQLSETRGGVGVTITTPNPTTAHYVQNPQLNAQVFNYQGQSTTTLYLHHGAAKTGVRSVATPAPGYTGTLQSRFMLNPGVNDLVVKYYDTANGAVTVSQVVDDQVLHPSVKLHKLIVHNVQTNSNSTNVARSIIARAVDTQTYDQSLPVSDSIDTILAGCAANNRTQFTLGGLDSAGTLHKITTGTNNCANLADHITTPLINGEVEIVHDATSTACMQELFNASIAMDPLHENYHIFIVDDLPGGLSGFSDITAQGAVIRKAAFDLDPERVAIIMLHEIGHGMGRDHLGNTNPLCLGADYHLRNLMCQGSIAGKLMSVGDCDAFFNVGAWLKDYN